MNIEAILKAEREKYYALSRQERFLNYLDALIQQKDAARHCRRRLRVLAAAISCILIMLFQPISSVAHHWVITFAYLDPHDYIVMALCTNAMSLFVAFFIARTIRI
jgi:hypothetical protein